MGSRIKENYKNGATFIADKFYYDISSDIFDLIMLGGSFKVADLVSKITNLKSYSDRTQHDVINLVCRQLCRDHSIDNPLVIRISRLIYQVPLTPN